MKGSIFDVDVDVPSGGVAYGAQLSILGMILGRVSGGFSTGTPESRAPNFVLEHSLNRSHSGHLATRRTVLCST